MEQDHQNGHSSQNKSARIRALAVAGKPISEIAREVGVRYQFAYNVVRHENLVKKDRKVTSKDRDLGSEDDGLLTARFHDALVYATELHRKQKRKGTSIPYAGHLLGVCSIVIDAGGDEDEAIAALLHDAAEDQGGEKTLDAIRGKFGKRVARIVAHLSDTFEDPKPAWRARKENYLQELRNCTDASIYLVSAADKLHNLRTMLDDLREVGEVLWDRFSAPFGRVDVLWYHEALLDIYEQGPADRRARRIIRDMRATLEAMRSLAAQR
jgi:hypothetical protein